MNTIKVTQTKNLVKVYNDASTVVLVRPTSNRVIIQSTGSQGPAGTAGSGGIQPPQRFNPDAGEVAADAADFTLAGPEAVYIVTLNGQVLDDDQYSLLASVLTVTPTLGFFSTSDIVLVYQST
jgi:hypothetical protein